MPVPLEVRTFAGPLTTVTVILNDSSPSGTRSGKIGLTFVDSRPRLPCLRFQKIGIHHTEDAVDGGRVINHKAGGVESAAVPKDVPEGEERVVAWISGGRFGAEFVPPLAKRIQISREQFQSALAGQA